MREVQVKLKDNFIIEECNLINEEHKQIIREYGSICKNRNSKFIITTNSEKTLPLGIDMIEKHNEE